MIQISSALEPPSYPAAGPSPLGHHRAPSCTVGSRQLFQFTLCMCLATQSCLTLCDPVDCSPLGSSVHGISRQECWSGLPFPSPGDLPHPEIKPLILTSPCIGRRILCRCVISYTRQCIYVNATLSVCPPLSSPLTTSTSLLSMSASLFLPCK